MSSMQKPQAGQIKISLDSGANIHSRNDHFVEPEDLGFESMEDWNNATEEAKSEAVEEYFNESGYPEYSWESGPE